MSEMNACVSNIGQKYGCSASMKEDTRFDTMPSPTTFVHGRAEPSNETLAVHLHLYGIAVDLSACVVIVAAGQGHRLE